MLVFANGAFAGGAYQPTEDRKKALVWNNDPKPEDAATWSGDRDPDGYATGPGTLKWYRVSRAFTTGSNIAARKKTEISSYSGTMVRGKFNGHVVTVDHGKSYYATFSDGRRKGHWSAGPLIVKAEGVEGASEKPAQRETETSAETQPSTEKISPEKAEARVEGEVDVPAAGPAEQETEVSSQGSEITKSEATEPSEPAPVRRSSSEGGTPKTQPAAPLIAQASTEEPGESATPREPVTKKAALAPGAVRAIERPTNAVAKKPEPPRAKPEKTENVAKSAKSTTSQPAKKVDTNLKEDLPAEGPSSAVAEKPQAPKSKSQNTSSSQPASKETPADDSISALTGPPKSLHSNPPPETNPPSQIPASAPVAAPPATPKLTAVNAMDIADIEARTRGYDLGEYQLPKAEYNSATDTWSVAYIPRDADSTAKKLNVTIQDKSGKAEVKK